jgi:cell division protein FtsQ
MRLNNYKISFLIIIITVLSFFSFSKNKERTISFKDIHFIESEFNFISVDSVNKLLTQTDVFSKNILKSDLNLKEVEQEILSNSYIDFVDVSVSIDGKVGIKIKEKNPVFRVLNEKYYLDTKGKTMSLSTNYSKQVPLILNRVESDKYAALGKLGYYIDRDKFLRNHISSLSYADEKIVFGLNDYPFILKMDGFDNYRSKFKNYQNFFLSVYSSGLLDSIKTVNLNFKNQVVIERK